MLLAQCFTEYSVENDVFDCQGGHLFCQVCQSTYFTRFYYGGRNVIWTTVIVRVLSLHQRVWKMCERNLHVGMDAQGIVLGTTSHFQEYNGFGKSGGVLKLLLKLRVSDVFEVIESLSFYSFLKVLLYGRNFVRQFQFSPNSVEISFSKSFTF